MRPFRDSVTAELATLIDTIIAEAGDKPLTVAWIVQTALENGARPIAAKDSDSVLSRYLKVATNRALRQSSERRYSAVQSSLIPGMTYPFRLAVPADKSAISSEGENAPGVSWICTHLATKRELKLHRAMKAAMRSGLDQEIAKITQLIDTMDALTDDEDAVVQDWIGVMPDTHAA